MEGWRLPNGWCIHLTEDSKCDIYEKRPRICRIDKHWKDNFKNGPHGNLSWASYCEWTHTICDELKEMHKGDQ